MRSHTAALVIAGALVSQSVLAEKAADFLTQPLVFAAAENSAQPSVVADAKRGQFVVSWQSKDAAGCSALKLSTLKPDGQLGAISQAGQGCDWFVNWADFPSVGVADNGDWLTYWLQKSGDSTYAYDIQMVRSHDQGRSWQPPFKVHSDSTQTEHGFVSLAPAGGDKMLAVWLDGRKMASEKSSANDAHASHTKTEHAHSDVMTLRSAVLGRAGSMSAEAEIDANVCTCCSTDLVRTNAGTKALHTLVFRDRSEAEIRDIGLANYQAGHWKSAGTVHADNWKIAGCPVNGPAIANSGNDTLVVWATMQDDALSVRARSLSGKPGEFLNLETGAGVQGRVDAAPWGKSNWLVSWLGASKAGRVTLYLAELDGGLKIVRRQALLEVPAGRNIGMPRLAKLGGKHALLVWTQASEAAGAGATKTQIAGVSIRSR
jgi:hypothetical protein